MPSPYLARMALDRSLARLVASLGNAGAQANAYRACEEHKLTLARIDALAQRLRPDLAAGAPVDRPGQRRPERAHLDAGAAAVARTA